MTDTELHWLAGWLEGEGCFMTSGGTAAISICSTDLDVLQRVVVLLGGATIREKKKTQLSHKQAYVAMVFAQQAADAMELILPLMGARRQAKIREVLEYRASIPARKSARVKERWTNPEYREKTRNSMLKTLADPVKRKQRSDRLKRQWADPEFRSMMLAAQQAKK